MKKILFFVFIVIMQIPLNNIFSGTCSDKLCTQKKTISGHEDNDTITMKININPDKDNDINDFGDVYIDYYYRYKKDGDIEEEHALFYLDNKEYFSNNTKFYNEEERRNITEDYIPTIKKVLTNYFGKTENDYKNGNLEFTYESCNYYYMKNGDVKRIFMKCELNPSKEYIVCDTTDSTKLTIQKNYKTITFNYTPQGKDSGSTFVHDIYFPKIKKIVTLEVYKTSFQGLEGCKISAKAYSYDIGTNTRSEIDEKKNITNETEFNIKIK